jgi:pimeloyl-ACP methyl ester carboxylesterase
MPTTHPVRDIFVEANGLRHHLIARGTPGSPVVMMIHGLAGQAHVFDGIANHLATRYHVYCLDVRGRGESAWGPPNGYGVATYVADLEAVREALGLQHFALVGTSMGGLISLNYAPRFPERVDRVVLNDVGPEIDPEGLKRILSYVGGAPEMFADMKAVIRYYKEHYAPMVEHLAEDQIADFARYNVRKSDTGVYVWKMDPAVRSAAAPAASMDQWEALKAMVCPVLVLRGALSDVLSSPIAQRMVETLPNGRLVEVPGVGHAPVLTEPVAVKALDEFLAG